MDQLPREAILDILKRYYFTVCTVKRPNFFSPSVIKKKSLSFQNLKYYFAIVVGSECL